MASRPGAWPAAQPSPCPGRDRRRGLDAHRADIERVEGSRDPGRAGSLLAALDALRGRAERGGLRAGWLDDANRTLRGGDGGRRTSAAHAHEGREFYPMPPDLDVALETWLADAQGPVQTLPLRATRLCLDLCFLHPWVDGNARTARLALDALVWSQGYALGPTFALRRAADDARGAQQMVWVLASLMVRRGP